MLRWKIAAAVTLPCLAVLLALGLPYLLPQRLQPPTVQIEPGERKAPLDSAIVLELSGSLSEEEIRRDLRTSPPVGAEMDIHVEYVARLPWEKQMDRGKTRVTINAANTELFEPGTHYEVRLRDQEVRFRTITLPEVRAVKPDVQGEANMDALPTNTPLVIQFSEPVLWSDEHLAIEPAAEFRTASEGTNGTATVTVFPESRWENSTLYKLTVKPGVEDLFGHHGRDEYSMTFATWPPPAILSVAPEGDSLPLDTSVRITLERAADRQSVEEAFAVEPAAAGSFEWLSETELVWKPNELAYSTTYSVQVGGLAAGGDAYVSRAWSFSTQDPPVFAEIAGSPESPTVLEAIPSGGLGDYSLRWSGGETTRKILAVVPYGERLAFTVTVTSGDQTATASLEVEGLPSPDSYVPQPCPAGWEIVAVSVCHREDVLPGPVRTFVARADVRDPAINLAALPAPDSLGKMAPVSDRARQADALVAVNGDFPHAVDGGYFTLGPIVSGGNFVFVPGYDGVFFALDQAGVASVGKNIDLHFELLGPSGETAQVTRVNSTPLEGELALFNEYRGTGLPAEIDACYVPLTLGEPGASIETTTLYCGVLSEVPVAPGGVSLMGRGAATDWLRQNVPGDLSLTPPQRPRFVVGGSHILLPSIESHPGYRVDGRHPRTAIGADAEGYVYLVVVDGRSESSVGMSIPELQAYLAGMGLTAAINLDGGGSSTFVLQGLVENTPSGGRERPLAAVIAVQRSAPVCAQQLVRC